MMDFATDATSTINLKNRLEDLETLPDVPNVAARPLLQQNSNTLVKAAIQAACAAVSVRGMQQRQDVYNKLSIGSFRQICEQDTLELSLFSEANGDQRDESYNMRYIDCPGLGIQRKYSSWFSNSVRRLFAATSAPAKCVKIGMRTS